MTRKPRLSFPARWLVRIAPAHGRDRREMCADLFELFLSRREHRGAAYAHWRLYRDVLSLWTERRATVAVTPASALAIVRDAGRDLTYALRLFSRQPAIMLLAVAGLSIGLGIATAAFSIVNAAVLRGEGVVDPDRAPGVLRIAERSVATSWSYDEFLHLREGATRMSIDAVLTESATVRTSPADVDGAPAHMAFVSGGFFTTTGGRTIAGRPLAAMDERQADSLPVVVSYMFWASRLDRDPAAIGRTIRIGRATATIIGIAERGFSVPDSRLLWLPLTAYASVYSGATTAGSPNVMVQVFGRLLPGEMLAEAEGQLSGVAGALAHATERSESPVRARLDIHTGLGRTGARDREGVATFVFIVIVLVLLLACANVATLLVSTAIAREREMAVRAAVGAGRWRIVRQLVTEGLALGIVSAGVGLLLAYWMLPAVGTMVEAPEGVDFAPDGTVFVFLATVTLLTAAGAGLAPAWHGRGGDLLTPLKGDGASVNRMSPRRFRSLLVAAQAAAAVVLVVLATFFVRAAVRAAAIDVGFDASGLYAVSASLGGSRDGDAALRSYWARALDEVRAVPGVAAVALTETTPFGGVTRSAIAAGGSVVHLNRTRAEYFETLGQRLIAGRVYTHEEIASGAPVAIISESLARAYWPDSSALGQAFPAAIPFASVRPTVIGVVSDVVPARLHDRSTLAIYEPLDPASEKFARMLIRVVPSQTAAIALAGQRLRTIAPDAEVTVTSVAAGLHGEAARPRALATLTGSVGTVAILLCAIGLYGLTMSVVGQRTRELGVRVAMGAEPIDLLRLLLSDSLRPIAIGVAIGTAAALLAGHALTAAKFFGISSQDPTVFGGAALLVLTTALAAVLIPTRRAAVADAAWVLRRP